MQGFKRYIANKNTHIVYKLVISVGKQGYIHIHVLIKIAYFYGNYRKMKYPKHRTRKYSYGSDDDFIQYPKNIASRCNI